MFGGWFELASGAVLDALVSAVAAPIIRNDIQCARVYMEFKTERRHPFTEDEVALLFKFLADKTHEEGIALDILSMIRIEKPSTGLKQPQRVDRSDARSRVATRAPGRLSRSALSTI